MGGGGNILEKAVRTAINPMGIGGTYGKVMGKVEDAAVSVTDPFELTGEKSGKSSGGGGGTTGGAGGPAAVANAAANVATGASTVSGRRNRPVTQTIFTTPLGYSGIASTAKKYLLGG